MNRNCMIFQKVLEREFGVEEFHKKQELWKHGKEREWDISLQDLNQKSIKLNKQVENLEEARDFNLEIDSILETIP